MSRKMRRRAQRARQRRHVYCAEGLEPRRLLTTFSVTNLNDSGAGSFRQAIISANAAATADVIDFLIGAQTISLASALPQITLAGGALTINGNDAVTVQRAPNAPTSFRIIDSLAPSLTINSLTLTGGDAGLQRGGGITATGNLTLNNTTVTNNKANNGGGIDLGSSSTLRLFNSTVSGNLATENGGGIYFFNNGTLSMESSTVSGNIANTKDGGGVYFFGVASAAPPSGFTANTLVVRNSTIDGNGAQGQGGGIALHLFTGTLLVQNSTITGNTANSASGGGGIGQPPTSTGIITVVSSVVAENINAAGPDIRSVSTVNVNNSAVGSNTGFILSGTSGSNRPFGEALQLSPLANNGGFTQTRAPALASPLINAGSNPAGLPVDQRGVPRASTGLVDIGAFELQQFVVTSAANAGAGTLRDAITQTNGLVGPDAIIFGGAAFSSPQTISLMSALPDITSPLTIAGNTTAQNLIVRRDPTAATNFRIFSALTAGSNLTLSNLTITGGNDVNGSAIEVNNGPLVTLDRVVVTGNRVAGGGGAGAIVCFDSFLHVSNSTISENSGSVAGGILVNGGSLLLENSTVNNNSATERGGGVLIQNTASAAPPPGFTPNTWVIRNSTIANNSCSGFYGGVSASLGAGTLLIQNSTITGNSTKFASGGVDLFNGPTLTLVNSIVSGNSSEFAGDDLDCDAAVTANFSAIGINSGFTLSGSSGNNLSFGANLKLSPLGNFGGATQTILPNVGSPLINAGSNALIPAGVTNDQRGAGFARVSGAAVDIGAVETQNYIVVTNADDSNAGSLRQAMLDANASSAFDTIVFDPTFFATPRTISLLSALPTLTGQVTLFGPGKDLLTVTRAAGAPNFRIFDSTATTLNLMGMTISRGNVGGGGAGLNAQGTAPNITLESVAITGNILSGAGDGGGVNVAAGGFVTVRNSTISQNTAAGGGGLKVSNGSFVLENSTLSGNQSGVGGGIYFGGTAAANPPIGFLPSTLVVRNSTITGSTGGGIRAAGLNGTLLIQNSTIFGNSGSSTAGGIQSGFATTLTIANSVVSGNTSPIASDISSIAPVNANFSAIGSNTGFSFAAGSGNNLAPGTNLKLGAVANNGGSTQTVLPLPGSPLINAGSSALVPAGVAYDQRGVGYARVLGSSVDIGAVETGTTFVSSRRLFYNNSALDGNNAGADTADDNAIDATKSPLLPGGSVASANISGYAKGINGVMIDVASLPAGAGPTASDFSFRSATTGGWGAGPVPSSVTIRRGVSPGIDRVTLIWNNAAPNASVLNGWLEVTMKANAVTGLTTADVFTFGNLAGDANGDRAVTVGDLGILATNFNKPSGATIAQGDFNGDGAITVGDLGILSTAFGKTLSLPPAGLLAEGPAKTATALTGLATSSLTRPVVTPRAIKSSLFASRRIWR